MGDGASLVWTGGDFLYALRGEDIEDTAIYDFWCYSLVENTWTEMADIPADPHDGGGGGVGDGGSLLHVGFWRPDYMDHIYALSGNQAHPDGIPDNRTYRYSISTNTWERLPDLPFGVGYYVGCRLGYAEGCIYAWQGTPSTPIWTGGGDDLAKYALSIDSNPPTIGVPFRTPSSYVEPDQLVQISVSVTDTETGVKNATLSFTTDDGVNWENLTMNRNASTGLYEATIPGQAAETWVKFMVVAFDYAGNDETRNGEDPYCAYWVVAEFPSIVIFVSFLSLALVTILVGKRKMKSGSF